MDKDNIKHLELSLIVEIAFRGSFYRTLGPDGQVRHPWPERDRAVSSLEEEGIIKCTKISACHPDTMLHDCKDAYYALTEKGRRMYAGMLDSYSGLRTNS